MEYHNIIFMHDYEDDSGLVSRFLDGKMGPVDMARHLAQWDYGSESEHTPYDEKPWGSADSYELIGKYIEGFGQYIVSWNRGLGYVALTRQVKNT